jgi:hypothetical protein
LETLRQVEFARFSSELAAAQRAYASDVERGQSAAGETLMRP